MFSYVRASYNLCARAQVRGNISSQVYCDAFVQLHSKAALMCLIVGKSTSDLIPDYLCFWKH